MKSVLFSCYGLGIGGIEKCLVNLINAMPEDEFDIDLLLMNPEYTLLKTIKRRVNILDSFEYVMNTTDYLHELAVRGGLVKNFAKTIRYILFRVLVKLSIKPWKAFSSVKKRYDIAVAYSQNDYSPYYVIDKIEAERKILWYHNGAYEKKDRDCKRDKAYYPQFDFIIAVSQDCRRVLMEKFESAASKILTLMNFYDIDDIRSKAQEPLDVVFSSDFVNIVTVARLTEEKGADIALAACKNLIDCGKKIRWYWIGDGNRSGNIEKEIAASHLQETFILMGNKANPYPYMGAADIYVQPSYYEAYSTTVFEAKALGKVIVATDVGGMRDQIETKKNGIIVPVNAVAISDAICMLLNDDKLYGQIRSAVQQTTFDPESNMEAYRKSVFE